LFTPITSRGVSSRVSSENIESEGYRMKRKDIKKRPMADTVLASLEPEEKEYRENDGNGL